MHMHVACMQMHARCMQTHAVTSACMCQHAHAIWLHAFLLSACMQISYMHASCMQTSNYAHIDMQTKLHACTCIFLKCACMHHVYLDFFAHILCSYCMHAASILGFFFTLHMWGVYGKSDKSLLYQSLKFDEMKVTL